MASPVDSAAQKRARWRGFFGQRLTGGDAEVDAATEAAMRALERGEGVDAIVAAGLEGARMFGTQRTSPRPWRADSPGTSGPPPPRSQARAEAQEPTAGTRTGYSARAASSAAPAGASRSGSGIGSATSGIVNGLQQRQEMFGGNYFTVWSFRLEHMDSAGHPMTPIPVEMRGRRFNGGINNGDLVDVGGRPQPGKLVRTRRVRNLTVGTDVRAIGRRHPILRVLVPLVFLVAFATLVFIVMHATNNGIQP